MAIVSIARERGAYGENVAHDLAKKMGYRFIDRTIIEKRLADMGLPDKYRQAYDEKKPGFFAAFSSAMEDYLRCLKNVVLEEAAEDNCIFLGRGTQFLLRNVPNAVCVRLIAPFDIRVKRISAFLDIDRRAAELEVQERDRDRNEFNRHFFDAEWSDASNYHMVINTGELTPESVEELILRLVEIRVTPEATAKARPMLKNMAYSSYIEWKLLNEQKLPVFFLEAKFDNGTLTLNGIAHSENVVSQAKNAALSIAGVDKVICAISTHR